MTGSLRASSDGLRVGRGRGNPSNGSQTGLSRARSASVAAAPPTALSGGAAGGRPVRVRHAPSNLNVYEHQAGVKVSVPKGKMCDTCKVKPALYPDKKEWNCADCQFKEPP